MSKTEHRVSVSSGKYTFIIPADDYRISILRYGEQWHGPQADASNALHSIMCDLDAARVVLAEVRRTLGYAVEGMVPSRGLTSAMELHDRLCDDQEKPSSWCGGSETT